MMLLPVCVFVWVLFGLLGYMCACLCLLVVTVCQDLFPMVLAHYHTEVKFVTIFDSD